MGISKEGCQVKIQKILSWILWTLLEPLMTMIVLSVVFGTLFGNKDPHFPVYILCGRLMYSFFSSATNGAYEGNQNEFWNDKEKYM